MADKIFEREDKAESISKKVMSYMVDRRVTPPISKDSPWYLRSSSIFYTCPMEEALCSEYNIKRTETIEGVTAITFSIGTHIHTLVQEALFKELYGKWMCMDCHSVIGDGNVLCPSKCEHCGWDGKFEYVEPEFINSELKLGGHVDGLLEYGTAILEIKTMNDRSFTNLNWGIPEGYLWQCNAYFLLTGLDKLIFMAMWKDRPEWKEYIVRRDEDVIRKVTYKCLLVKDGIENGSKSISKKEGSCTCKSATDGKDCVVFDKCPKFKE